MPGSDLDGTGIIVDGEKDAINDFSRYLWENLDPTIVSARKDLEFPDTQSLYKLCQWAMLTEAAVSTQGLNENEDEYAQNLYSKDYRKAFGFNTDASRALGKMSPEAISEFMPDYKEEIASWHKDPRDITQAVSAILEVYRSGSPLIQNPLNEKQQKAADFLKSTYLYKYGNMCMQETSYGLKGKLLARKEFQESGAFEKMDTDTKLDLILRMIEESYPNEAKNKMPKHYGQQFDYLFSNGNELDGRVEAMEEAFSGAFSLG